MTQEEKRNICLMMRHETGCGLMEASVAIDKLIKAFKNRPLLVMDKPVYLKIAWEYAENKNNDEEIDSSVSYDTEL